MHIPVGPDLRFVASTDMEIMGEEGFYGVRSSRELWRLQANQHSAGEASPSRAEADHSHGSGESLRTQQARLNMATQRIDLSSILKRRNMMGRGASWLFDGSPAPRVKTVGELKQVAITPEVESMLQRSPVCANSVSGGKDGVSAALAVNRYLDSIGFKGKRVIVFADLGRIEWTETRESCEGLARYLGQELIVAKTKGNEMIDVWERRWANCQRRYAALECVKLIPAWSSSALRFCTAAKTQSISSALRKRFPGEEILSVVGIRRQESKARSLMPVSKSDARLVRASAGALTWNAIIEFSIEDVLDEHQVAGIPLHYAYTEYGSSRLSCSFCVMSAWNDLVAAARCPDNLDAMRLLVDLEARSTFSFQSNRWLADVAPHHLSEDVVARIAEAKIAASARTAAESRLHGHLLFTKGWPECMPTAAEAELIASVRREVSDVVGIKADFLTGPAVLARYAELMAEKAVKDALKGSKRCRREAAKGEVAEDVDDFLADEEEVA